MISTTQFLTEGSDYQNHRQRYIIPWHSPGNHVGLSFYKSIHCKSNVLRTFWPCPPEVIKYADVCFTCRAEPRLGSRSSFVWTMKSGEKRVCRRIAAVSASTSTGTFTCVETETAAQRWSWTRARRWEKLSEGRWSGLFVPVRAKSVTSHLFTVINTRMSSGPRTCALWFFSRELHMEAGEGTRF